MSTVIIGIATEIHVAASCDSSADILCSICGKWFNNMIVLLLHVLLHPYCKFEKPFWYEGFFIVNL